jgi:hypothetical protein
MNRAFLVAWIVVFLVWMLGSYVVHGVLLSADYARIAHLFRTEAESQRYFPLMLVAHAIMAFAFVWIYSRGIGSSPWVGQGVRYGLAVALLTAIPWYMIYFVVQPMPGGTVVKQMVFDTILTVLLGVVVAFMYRAPGNTQYRAA